MSFMLPLRFQTNQYLTCLETDIEHLWDPKLARFVPRRCFVSADFFFSSRFSSELRPESFLLFLFLQGSQCSCRLHKRSRANAPSSTLGDWGAAGKNKKSNERHLGVWTNSLLHPQGHRWGLVRSI